MQKRYIILAGVATKNEVKSGCYSLDPVLEQFATLRVVVQKMSDLVRKVKKNCYNDRHYHHFFEIVKGAIFKGKNKKHH